MICGKYNSEQNASMELATAFENKTVRQTLAKTAFFQSELGMRVASCSRSRRFSQKIKIGTRAAEITRSAIFTGWRMFEIELVNVLQKN